MILHLLTNEQFADYAIAQFSAPEMDSELVLIPCNHEEWHIKMIDKCTIIRPNSQDFVDLLNRLDQYSAIFFHGLFWGWWQIPILERAPKSVKVAWYFWGGEIYSRQDLELAFLSPITKLSYRLYSIKKTNNSNNFSGEIPLERYSRVNYCLTSMREEAEYAKNYTKASFQHKWYTYYSLEDTIGALMTEQCRGNNVWIGNSAAVENNHLDVLWTIFKKRRKLSLEGREIIMPLSYGSPWIRNLVKKVGHYIFNDSLNALETYIPRNEYNSMMLSCSTMILGYTQPAAQGNIITGLWLGMRVYLRESSMSYAYYKRIGANVFSLEKDLKTYGFSPLSKEEREENRKVLKKWYSKEHVEQAVKDVVNELR